MRQWQLKALAWIFAALLPPRKANDEAKHEDYYKLLGLEGVKDKSTVTQEDLKKAYRKRSLQLHPDKLAQRATATAENTDPTDAAAAADTDKDKDVEFAHMKEAYEVLSNPDKKRIYDDMGIWGLQLLDSQSTLEPSQMTDNLAKSSCFDRTKLVAVLGFVLGLLALQPILIAVKVNHIRFLNHDTLMGTSWFAILVPTWIFIAVVWVFLACLVEKRAHPTELKAMPKRVQHRQLIGPILNLLKWTCLFWLLLFLSLRWDSSVSWKYRVVLIPLYFYEIFSVVKSVVEMLGVRQDIERMVTLTYLEEHILNNPEGDDNDEEVDEEAPQLERFYADLNEEERDALNEDFIIVHVPPRERHGDEDEDDEHEESEEEKIESSVEYKDAIDLHKDAFSMLKQIILYHTVFIGLLIAKLDAPRTDWSWWLVFIPLWIQFGVGMAGNCFVCFCIDPHADQLDLDTDSDHANDEELHGADATVSDSSFPKQLFVASSPPKQLFVQRDEHLDNNDNDDDYHLYHDEPRDMVMDSPMSPNSDMMSSPMSPKSDGTSLSFTTTDESPPKITKGKGLVSSIVARIEAKDKASAAAAAAAAQKDEVESTKPFDEEEGDIPAMEMMTETNVDVILDQDPTNEMMIETDVDVNTGLEMPMSQESPLEHELDTGMPDDVLKEVMNLSEGDVELGQMDSSQDEDEDYEVVMEEEEPHRNVHGDDEAAFREWQQANEEEEARAMDLQAKALGSCCRIIIQLMMACLFVGCLESNYNAMWVIFPALLVMGIIMICFSCGVYCGGGSAQMEEMIQRVSSQRRSSNSSQGSPEAKGSKEDDSMDIVFMPPPPPPVSDQEESTAPIEEETKREVVPDGFDPDELD
mmetsp:Transcript_4352/g.7786  ORF Transcript_4352/g.7786 Transcript_4352/m.7786 type:complete len:864 (-) Transcript_4352:80-2671(-)|eukprot:CAMPEP_0198285474 /NCGR_PEP_ID=MMETSP1449-20131203/4736_1 /TAXON_ID=420275 /ORGANISM="Attheya septentrionalis, Strain CCMP2084" /LENGTH=863 /DNA_ID=CAMNT_0043982883 /DNA_START=308 /DNA_END=2899 /DNA_ORIENTATION=-